MRVEQKAYGPPVSVDTKETAARETKRSLPKGPGTGGRTLLALAWLRRTIAFHVRSRIVTHRHMISSVAAVSGGNMIASVLRVLGGLLIARFLGPEETGLFQSYTIPLIYLTFLHLGTFDGMYRQIPYYTGKERPDKVRALASAAGAWNILMSSIVSAGFVVCALYGAWRGDWFSVAGWLSQAVFAWDAFYGGFLTTMYRTAHHFVQMARMQVQQGVLAFAMVFLVPFIGLYGLCVRIASIGIVGTWLYHRHRPIRVRYGFDREALKEVIRVGLPFNFWGSLYTTAWTATESALMLALGGVTGLGLFVVAVVIREGLNIIPLAVNQVIMPRVVESFAREGTLRTSSRRLLGMTAGLVGVMLPVVLAVSYLLDVIVPFAFPKYVEGLTLMKICSWFVIVQAAALPLNTLFATGRAWIYGRGVILGLAVFLGFSYLLIPLLGSILAVAVGSLLGRTARTIVTYLEIIVLTRREARGAEA